jgi:hypothetical protein
LKFPFGEIPFARRANSPKKANNRIDISPMTKILQMGLTKNLNTAIDNFI